MTIQQIIDMTDSTKANMMPRNVKVMFLNEIENKVHQEILMKHVHSAEDEDPPVYDDTTDGSTQMLVTDAYASLYWYWLYIKIDQQNQEPDKEYNDNERFKAAWEDFSDWYTREHTPMTSFDRYII